MVVDLARPNEPQVQRRNWSWLWSWLRPWRTLTAGAAVLIPIPSYDWYSVTSTWSGVLQDARTDGLTTAYILAGVAFGCALLADTVSPRWITRAALITTAIGGTGALGWYDPITLITGVHP
ncbi:hypothetical protein ABZ752_15265 [Streptomyces roseifaciens]